MDDGGNEVTVSRDLVAANFTNCIVDGNQNIEFVLDKVDGAAFNYNIKNSMLKFSTTNADLLNNPLYDFTDTGVYQNTILNGNAQFKDVENNEYIIGQDSEANGSADGNGAMQVPFDILNISRIASPDIGAYQHIIFEDN